MLRVGRGTLRRLGGETRGSEIAEAAAVLPIVFMMVLGVFWFGQAFRIYGTIAHAARQGARAGATPGCTTCAAGSTTPQKAFAAVQNALVSAKLDPNLAQWPTVRPSLVSCSSGAPVACDVGQTKVCVQENVQLSKIGSGAAGVCGISVSFQYPYQFWLPFTTLNAQKIQLQAVARMRMEMP
ncbi:MAG: pilus assembly protein [Acidobacteriia bacterium]|nr:pilus assembly protein [Terriglobia bacterium]